MQLTFENSKHDKIDVFLLPSKYFRQIVISNQQTFLMQLLRNYAVNDHGNTFTSVTEMIFKAWPVILRTCKNQGKYRAELSDLKIPPHTLKIIRCCVC